MAALGSGQALEHRQYPLPARLDIGHPLCLLPNVLVHTWSCFPLLCPNLLQPAQLSIEQNIQASLIPCSLRHSQAFLSLPHRRSPSSIPSIPYKLHHQADAGLFPTYPCPTGRHDIKMCGGELGPAPTSGDLIAIIHPIPRPSVWGLANCQLRLSNRHQAMTVFDLSFNTTGAMSRHETFEIRIQ